MKNNGPVKLKVVSSVQDLGMSVSVAMVNRTVKYECALNFCVVNVLAQQ